VTNISSLAYKMKHTIYTFVCKQVIENVLSCEKLSFVCIASASHMCTRAT